MLLKKLELLGFKSFADKTEFVFEPGITALVGPNGCGKSNVVDAVKWILGEQSVKSLRGTEMADIIFNGTGARRSLGFAEATLTFDNADRRLALDFDEVAITRRVYRDGQGEYFINKQPCRLKDIKNALLDTGMGMQCYSVIEQGRIDQILVASSVERRRIFDEASGISKYKARRREAQTRLERVEQNLLRLADIVDEVEKQLRSVKYQAAKARRYREYSDELKRLKVSYSLKEFDGFSKRSAETSAKLQALDDDRTRAVSESDLADAARLDAETRAASIERDQQSAQSLLADLRQSALAAEDAIQFNHTRVREQQELHARYQGEHEDLAARTAEMRSELDTRAAELETLAREVEGGSRVLDETSGRLTGTRSEEAALAAGIEEKKTVVVEMMQQASRLENELGVLASECRGLAAQIQRQAARLSEVAAELHDNERSIHQAEEEIAAVDRVIDQLLAQTREKETQRRDLGGRVESLRALLAERLQRKSSLQSRFDVLRDLDEKQEGIDQGVREVLARLRPAQTEIPASSDAAQVGSAAAGLHGMLGEKLSVDATYARAVEAALGHRAQTLVVSELAHAVEGLRIVNESGKGRASFLPLSHCKIPGNGHPLPEGILGRLKDFVRCDDPGFTPVVECLLGDVLLVEDMDRACAVKAHETNGFVLVTLAGEVIETTGIITGGRGTSGGGIISRAAERRAVDAELQAVRLEAEGLEASLRDGQLAESAVGSEIERLDELVDREKSTRSARSTAVELFKEKSRLLGEEHAVLSSEQADVERQRAELETRQADVKSRLDDLKRQEAELESSVETLSRSREELGLRRHALQEQETQLKVTLARSRQRHEGLSSAIDALRANLEIREDELERLRASIEDARRKQAEAEAEIAARETELEDLRSRQEEQEQVVAGFTTAREELRTRLVGLEKTGHELKLRLTDLDAKLGELRLEAQELKLKMENLVQRVREEYQLELAQMFETYQAEEMNWPEVAARIEELRLKVANMGNVNLDAIDSEDALSRRADFLNTQRKDLLEAKRQLEEIISRLNKESLEMFEKSFTVIRENFQEMFRKLFGGGKADLFLEDEQDVLESGIEIIARPPGKEPRSISLLSGGEKVMTAVALLFAIFKSRPSPFCLLDEVDAALDEANIGRFSNIVQEFLKLSQFIIITHSKRTMSVADVIYGITMQESGVSKKISVKFSDYEQQVA